MCVFVRSEAESSVCIETNTTAGYLQAVDSAGTPLCLSCQKPSGEHRGWAGGFCSPACMEDFQLRSNQGYMRARVLETEQGVCQHCGLNAHQLYVQVRDAPHTHRKEMLDNTWLAQLPLKQVEHISRILMPSSAYLARNITSNTIAAFYIGLWFLFLFFTLKYCILNLLKCLVNSLNMLILVCFKTAMQCSVQFPYL